MEEKVKTKTLSEILNLDGEPNILENMVDNNFKEYKIKLLKKNGDLDAIVLDGFDNALIGLSHNGCLIYDVNVMCKILEDRDKMCLFDALVFLDYNVLNTKFGELNPIFITLHMDLVLQTLK